MNFGIECEVESGTVGLLDALGLDSVHDYHCDCSDCDPFRSSPDFTIQEDCTADGEVISRVLAYGSPEATDAIALLADALKSSRATTSTNQGLHIHVGTEAMGHEAWVYFWRLWFRYQNDVGDLAAGRFGDVRSYNSPNIMTYQIGDCAETFWSSDDLIDVYRRMGRTYCRTHWVNCTTGHDTVEFRLWNATRVEWRIHLAVGVSCAIVQAALDGVNVTEHDERTLVDVLAPYLTTDTYAAIVRHYLSKELAA